MDETEFEKLEIDNWVLHKRLPKQISKKVYKPGDIAFVEFKNESGIASRNDISPIPLSNTILLKNRFKEDSCKANKLTLNVKDNLIMISIEYSLAKKEWLIYDEDLYSAPNLNPSTRSIHYVHELQNYVKKRTKEEFEITL